jgi:hypothetical protein
MTAETIRWVLGWAALINIGILLFWFALLMLARDPIYRLHSKLFKLSEESFGALQYGLIGFYELAIFIFLLGPYFGLQIVGGR